LTNQIAELALYKSAQFGTSSCQQALETKLEVLEIGQDGKILSRTDLGYGAMPTMKVGKFYRLRWSLTNLKTCSFISEAFSISWL
jgi:hypothetical protein